MRVFGQGLYTSSNGQILPNVNAYYGIYSSVQQATTTLQNAFGIGYIPEGYTVAVKESGILKEYWWDGTQLIVKGSTSSVDLTAINQTITNLTSRINTLEVINTELSNRIQALENQTVTPTKTLISLGINESSITKPVNSTYNQVVVTAYYSDSSSIAVTSLCEVNTTNANVASWNRNTQTINIGSTAGTTATLTFYYGNKSVDLQVTVEQQQQQERTISSVTYSLANKAQEQTVGNYINVSAEITYNNGDEETVQQGINVQYDDNYVTYNNNTLYFSYPVNSTTVTLSYEGNYSQVFTFTIIQNSGQVSQYIGYVPYNQINRIFDPKFEVSSVYGTWNESNLVYEGDAPYKFVIATTQEIHNILEAGVFPWTLEERIVENTSTYPEYTIYASVPAPDREVIYTVN